MIDALVNWLLDLVNAAVNTLPTWSPTLPSPSGLLGPLAQINWLVDLTLPYGIALAMLALGPAFIFTSLTLWVIGLFTPSTTSAS